MAVIHYRKDSEIVCNTKGKSLKSTNNPDEVTCKRCMKKPCFRSNKYDIEINDIDTLLYYINSGKIEIVNHANGDYYLKSKDKNIKKITVNPDIIQIVNDTNIQGAY